jgi:rSAM/selenodomain-associated transferase 1
MPAPSVERNVLIVFTRYPKPGQAKTRLIPVLGTAGAAELSRRLTAHTLAEARLLAKDQPVAVQVWYEGGDEPALAACFGAATYRQQTGSDLGGRMSRAFERVFADSAASRAVLVGTDCPSLSAAVLRAAFDALARCDLVFGPAHDGGYYLIGLKRAVPELFQGIAWGTSSVHDQTVAIAERLGLTVAAVATLHDVDRPEDLAHLPAHLARDLAQSD